jgi:hypothetical protein
VPHDEPTQVTVDHQPAHHDAPDPQARQRTARYVHALLGLNPDRPLPDIARAYAAIPNPDPDALALLDFLAHQTLRIDTAGRS